MDSVVARFDAQALISELYELPLCDGLDAFGFGYRDGHWNKVVFHAESGTVIGEMSTRRAWLFLKHLARQPEAVCEAAERWFDRVYDGPECCTPMWLTEALWALHEIRRSSPEVRKTLRMAGWIP